MLRNKIAEIKAAEKAHQMAPMHGKTRDDTGKLIARGLARNEFILNAGQDLSRTFPLNIHHNEVKQ